MAHHNHHHLEPFVTHAKHSHGTITPNVYGALTGSFDHWTLSPHDGTHADDNHIYVWLKVESLMATGKFECAVNVESSRMVGNASPDKLELRYHLMDETVEETAWPPEGFTTDAALSFAKLGLHESDFQIVTSGALRTLVAMDALQAQRIAVYGMTYSDGTGIHDVHQNTGDHDGAIIFYYDAAHGGPKARWVFLKFATPVLT